MLVPTPERRNVKHLSYLPENVVGIDTRGQYVVVKEMDKESENLEELSYCL